MDRKEDEVFCDNCEKEIVDSQMYESGTGGESGWICLDCYTSLIDNAMDLYDEGDWPPRETPEPR